MEATGLISWLVQRMGWVYKFVVVTLGLPSWVGYMILSLLIILFFYELYHIYKNRNKGIAPLIWLIIILAVPLGTLIYLAFGMRMLSRLPEAIQPAAEPVAPVDATSPGEQPGMQQPQAPAQITPKSTAATVLGTVVAITAWVAGGIAVVFFVFVGLALLSCHNDPKCM